MINSEARAVDNGSVGPRPDRSLYKGGNRCIFQEGVVRWGCGNSSVRSSDFPEDPRNPNMYLYSPDF